jgi:hypothetical protein
MKIETSKITKLFSVALFAFLFSFVFSNVLLAGGQSIKGKITQKGDAFLMIETSKVMIGNTTAFYDMNYQQVHFDYFKIGMLVEAVAVVDGNNLVAIKVIEQKVNSDLYTMTGTIGGVGDNHILLAGVKILFNYDTKFYDIYGNLVNQTMLKIGLNVEVQYKKTTDGMVAVIIKALKTDDGQEVVIKGTLTEIRKDGITVDKTAMGTNADTKVYDEKGNLIDFGALRVGMTVEVKALKVNGGLVALMIKIVSTQNNQYIEHKGIVTKILDGILIVGDKEFKFGADVKVYLPDGTLTDISHLKVGMEVYVYAQDVNNVLVAIKIKILTSTDDNKYMELKGIIDELKDGSLTLSGKVFKFGQVVKVLRADGTVGGIDLLKVRMNVVIKAQYINGEWYIIQVNIVDNLSGDGFGGKGIITQVTKHSIIVIGKEFLTNSSTVVYLPDGSKGSLADLKEGLMVEIQGKIFDGEITALVIRIFPHEGEKDKSKTFELKGIIKTISGNTVVVGDRKFNFNDETIIMYDNGQKADKSHLKPGLTIEAYGIIDQNGVLIAQKIIIKTSANDNNYITIKDYITKLTNTSITCQDRIFQITSETKIYDANGNLIEISGLKIGDLVYVYAIVKDNHLVALYIKLLPPSNDVQYIVIKGKIIDMTDYKIAVGDKVFLLNKDTKVYKADGSLGSLKDLSKDLMVEVKGIYDNNKNLTALIIKLIKIESNSGRTVEIKGIVKEVGTDYIIVGDRKILVGDQTLYFLANGEPTELSSITKGLMVVVKATFISNTELLAIKVMIKDDQTENNLFLKGIIKKLGYDYMIVNETKFLVNDKTLFYNAKGELVQFSDLSVDMGVYVKAVFVNGGYMAVYVKLLEIDGLPGIIDRSKVTDIIEGYFYSDCEDYITDELTTKVEDLFGYPYQLTYLKPGMIVDVESNIYDGMRYATSITIIDDMTSVDEGTVSFNVQATPNPFTESLNISLNLTEESNVAIRLYNINGSLVSNVFEGSAPAGANNYNLKSAGFNAGMYFMTVSVNGKHQLVKVEIIK